MKARLLLLLAPLALSGCFGTVSTLAHDYVLPEARSIEARAPEQFASYPVPALPAPRTVTEPGDAKDWDLSLDEAIKVALVNAKVVRVLTGLSASSSGRTIFDAAIANANIDVEQARFDPTFGQTVRWNQTETPQAQFDPFNPGGAFITGTRVRDTRYETTYEKVNVFGGSSALRFTADPTVANVPRGTLPLNPSDRTALELNYTQPLLQGGGLAFNLAPVVIARIDTERSFFQLKDATQELVRGVIDGYWALVQARTDVWARQNQFELADADLEREEARRKVGLANTGELSQKRVSREQFRAQLIASKANVLAREGALRNLLFLPPEDKRRLVPTSPPTKQKFLRDWDALLRLTERQRPDVIELKLVLEADAQRLIQAENRALPRLDAVALYRWNGLSGEAPNGQNVATGFGQFTDYSLGVNFSVPLGLREGRARTRQAKLVIARDRANLDQALHAAVHELAITSRDLDNAYAQYEANREVRDAALANLKFQIAKQNVGQQIYLNVLQAINDWGNAVSAEAQALTTYNTALATLERQTGTILETHGLVFMEEQFRAAGPIPCHPAYYPRATRYDGNPARYPGGDEPAENSFDLRKPSAALGPPVPLPPAGK